MANDKYVVMADVLQHKKRDNAPQDENPGHYVKVKVDIPAGTILQVQDPRKLLEFFVERGFVSEEEAEERLKQIPDFLTANLVLRPSKRN